MLSEFNNAPGLNVALATAVTKFENREELGCMVTDAIREASGADFAFQNTGGLRIDYLKKGPITVKDVYTIDPFGNEIVVFQMTGQQVKRFIVNSYKKNGGFPSYVSGMTYEVSDSGKDISVFVRPDKGNFSMKNIYKVAINSFMASTVNIESVDEGQSLFMTTEEALIDFLRKHKTVDYQGVSRTR
jgi:5'-nucleotidase